MNTYEGMFLFDPTFASEWPKVEAEIGRLLERAGAEPILVKKWDERKLAYEIEGRKRGCYVLTYFKAAAGSIGGLERDVQLSEPVLRCLILKAETISQEKMNAPAPADPARPVEEEPVGHRPDAGTSKGDDSPPKDEASIDVADSGGPEPPKGDSEADSESEADPSTESVAQDANPVD